MNNISVMFNLSHASQKPDGLHVGIIISSGLKMRRAVVGRGIDVLSNLSINETGLVYSLVP